MSLCISRWLGVMLVITAMSGLRRIEISWKLESSTTAKSFSRTSSMSGSSARPILPPRCTRYPASFRISEIRVVLVVLPSLPVTAIVRQGQSSKNSSISLVTATPFLRSSSRTGRWNFMPGVRRTMSASIPSR